MKLLYIAAPYRAKTICSLQQNIHEAKLMAMYYWNKGYAVVCPHMNSKNLDGLVDDNQFLLGTLEILSRCDYIAMHPNWEQSSGSIAENDYMFRKQRKENKGKILKSTIIFYPEWDEILTILDKLYKEG